MYSHGFTDLDGHVWEVMWMDPDVITGEKPVVQSADQ